MRYSFKSLIDSTYIVKFCMGGRFCSLDHLYKKFSGNDVFPSPKLIEDQKQKKGEVIFPLNQVKTKKRSSPQFATIFGRKFVGSFSPGWLFCLCFSSAQPLEGERLNLDGGTRPPYNLSTAYQRWSPRGRPWPRGRPQGHFLKSLASKVKSLASKPLSPRKLPCPRLEDSTIFLNS